MPIESGCDRVLQRINKRITRQQISNAVRIVQRCGLQLNIGFIMFEPDSTLGELEENYAFLEELGLLDEPDLTVNLLYHNQIVLHGSPAWQRFEGEDRLLVDESLPFEARYRFRDERVGLVCAAMGRLASHYFKGISSLRRQKVTRNTELVNKTIQLNVLLKDAFCTFGNAARTRSLHNFTELEGQFSEQLQTIFATSELPRTDETVWSFAEE